MIISFYIHCNHCGEHSEIQSRGYQEQCACSSIDWVGIDQKQPGECKECDEIANEIETTREAKLVFLKSLKDSQPWPTEIKASIAEEIAKASKR